MEGSLYYARRTRKNYRDFAINMIERVKNAI